MHKIVYGFLILTLISCSSAIEYVSNTKNVDIRIDGDYTEWQSILKPIEKEGFAAGFLKDKNKIYGCFVVSDRIKINKILRNGCTIFLRNDKDKIGIKYPLIDNISKIKTFRELRNFEPRNDEYAEDIMNRTLETFNEYTIVNKDDYPLNTFDIKEKSNFQLKLSYYNYKLVYEFEINTIGLTLFENDNQLKNIDIGIVSNVPKLFREDRRALDFENRNGDNISFDNGKRNKGTFGEKRRENMEEMQKPFEYWFNIKFK